MRRSQPKLVTARLLPLQKKNSTSQLKKEGQSLTPNRKVTKTRKNTASITASKDVYPLTANFDLSISSIDWQTPSASDFLLPSELSNNPPIHHRINAFPVPTLASVLSLSQLSEQMNEIYCGKFKICRL